MSSRNNDRSDKVDSGSGSSPINFFGLAIPADESISDLRGQVANQLKNSLKKTNRYFNDGHDDTSVGSNCSLADLFQDSGLPGSERYPTFSLQYIDDWAAGRFNGPTCAGASVSALTKLLPDSALDSEKITFGEPGTDARYLLAARNPRFGRLGSLLFFGIDVKQIRKHEHEFHSALSLLSSLNWDNNNDAIRPAIGQAWRASHNAPLIQYFIEFFSERFHDRNGTSISASAKLDSLTVAKSEVSPVLVGQLIGLFIEFLFDRKFGVPFFSKPILSAFSGHRNAQLELIEIQNDIDTLEMALKAKPGTYWDLAGSTPFMAAEPRQKLIQLHGLDQQFSDTQQKIVSLHEEIAKIRAGESKSQFAFTCFKTGLITEHLKCVFLNGNGVCTDDTTGEGGVDYADLLGCIVKYSANQAEKQTRAVVGTVIRGLSIASINNEALSELIAAAAGTIAKKTAEVLTFEFMSRFITSPEVMPGNAAGKKQILDLLEKLHVLGTFKSEDNPFEFQGAVEDRLGFTPEPTGKSLQERENIAIQRMQEGKHFRLAEALPNRFDLRSVGGKSFITGIRNQKNCGSCVAFGVAAALESRWAVQNGGTLLPSGEEIDLSEAHLFYCYGKTAGRNCGNGWWPAAPLEKVRDEGVVPEACFPYTPGIQDCVVCSGPGYEKWKITGYERLTDPASMKSWLTEKGALVTAFSVYNNFKSFFASEPNGVYRETRWPRVGGHCVCCVGFDDNQACWIIKNSWGPFFGDQGFFRIGYGVAGIDFEMFGALEVSEP